MKMIIKHPFLKVHHHVLDNLKTIHNLKEDIITTITKGLYSNFLQSWLYTDNEFVFKVNANKSCKVYIDINGVNDMYEIGSILYLIHKNEYTVYDQDLKRIIYSIRLNSIVEGFSEQYGICYITDNHDIKAIDFHTDGVYCFGKKKGTCCSIGKDINNKFYQDLLNENKLVVNGKEYDIPLPPRKTDTIVHSLNEKYIVVQVRSDDEQNWYSLFDKKSEKFTKWCSMECFIKIEYLCLINKIQVYYDDCILILSNTDLQNLFRDGCFNALLFSIDRGNDSMIYYGTQCCLNEDQSYIVYINNDKLMATMTHFPYTMHILCDIPQPVVYIGVNLFEILIQFEDLSLILLTL